MKWIEELFLCLADATVLPRRARRRFGGAAVALLLALLIPFVAVAIETKQRSMKVAVGDAAGRALVEMLLPASYEVVTQHVEGNRQLFEFVERGETAAQWTEMVTVEFLPYDKVGASSVRDRVAIERQIWHHICTSVDRADYKFKSGGSRETLPDAIFFIDCITRQEVREKLSVPIKEREYTLKYFHAMPGGMIFIGRSWHGEVDNKDSPASGIRRQSWDAWQDSVSIRVR